MAPQRKREETIAAPLSPTGATTRVWYSLTGDFGHESRAALRRRAKKERKVGIRRTQASAGEGAS